MRTTATRKQTIATPLQRISPLLVKWTSLFLVLLVMMVTTFSGRLLPITRANPSHKNRAAVIPSGCPTPDAKVPNDEVYMNYIGDWCYYYMTLGCTGSYNKQAGNYCVAMNSNWKPTSPDANQCPSVSETVYIGGPNNKTCFYFAAQGFSSCAPPYTVYVFPDCTPAFGSTGNASSGNDIPGGLFPGCPSAASIPNSQIFVSHMKDQCYYDMKLGPCTDPYQLAGGYCIAKRDGFLSGSTDKCPPAPGQTLQTGDDLTHTCFYFAAQGSSSCAPPYTVYEIPDCTTPPGSPGNDTPGSNNSYEGYPNSPGQIPSCSVSNQEGFDTAPQPNSNATFKTLTDVSCAPCVAGGDGSSFYVSGTDVACVF
ncbi:MAG TPA: hypothetical protein VHV10_12940, partial [Ktedonobacteraceae bacterium]|nr:hypothetical protein [Ktedonobacteraceae bacterium]